MNLTLRILLSSIMVTGLIHLSAQRLEMQATRVVEIPHIDGKLDDPCWVNHPYPEKKRFTQNSPANGEPSRFLTDLYIVYTDFALYVAAQMYDPSPDSIPTELGLRDDGGRNTDMFGIGIDPYQNRQNAFIFWLTSAGVQGDSYETPGMMDENWNAVWKSGVEINDEGWAIEMEIPYSMLRFPKKDIQEWGINFYRRSIRFQEEAFWNPIDANINGAVNQYGDIKGIENIQPPIRLSLTPYISTYLNKQGSDPWAPSINGGMDLKYGLNESFTLDMSLIPDFGQVRSDNIVLNLTPFEVRLEENRPFFTEGTELFDKGNLFYSRRVGAPSDFVGELRDGEGIESRPSQTPLINATKFSGRNQNGLGIGVFNAVTNRTTATVSREVANGNGEKHQETRQVEADPLTNYNVVVFDQNLKNNSNLSVINTNVWREGRGRDANVTGVFWTFNDSSNTWNTEGRAVYSHVMRYDADSGRMVPKTGYAYTLTAGKISGRWQFFMRRNVESYNLDFNDMGFLFAPNEITHQARGSFQRNEPFAIFNSANVNLGVQHTKTHMPNEFDNMEVDGNLNMNFKNFWNLWMGFGVSPVERVNHFEPRTDAYVFRQPVSGRVNLFLNTDSRKRFALGTGGGVWRRPEWNSLDNWIEFAPRFRFSDRFSISHVAEFQWRRREYGYATKLYTEFDELDQIIFGRRNVRTFTNTLNGSYTFNPYSGLNLRIRHYWSRVQYDRFWQLTQDGYFLDTDYTLLNEDGVPRHDANFNFFSVDLVYSWQFAPGSFLSAVWKNNIQTFSSDPEISFQANWQEMINAPDMLNSFSVRMIYFLDYLDARRVVAGKQ